MRKLRTRQHVLEDLSYNFVEKQILLAGFVFRMYPERQYSYDAWIETFTEIGEIENGLIYVQVKATKKLRFSKKCNGFILDIEKRDIDLWINELSPVIVVLYGGETDSSYFINLGTIK